MNQNPISKDIAYLAEIDCNRTWFPAMYAMQFISQLEVELLQLYQLDGVITWWIV